MGYFDRPKNHTLRMAIAHFEECLGINWCDYNQSVVSDELVFTFAQALRNLPPRALKRRALRHSGNLAIEGMGVGRSSCFLSPK